MNKTFRHIAAACALFAGIFNISAQLPSVQLKDLSGKPVDSSTLSNDGKPFIIDFWATWCKPCVRELKAIHESYPDWVDETGVKLYAIATDDAQNSFKVKASPKSRAGNTLCCLIRTAISCVPWAAVTCPTPCCWTATATSWNHIPAIPTARRNTL